MKKPFIICFALILVVPVFARRYYSSSRYYKQHRIAQVTFAYPLGSSALNSMDYSNSFSFNILYGLNGGVAGMEIGGAANYNRGHVNGLQIAGLANINDGNTNGLIISGGLNYFQKKSNGIMISGAVNYSRNTSTGLCLAPVNIAANDVGGVQVGVLNIADRLNGLQIGVVNISKINRGIPVGLVNIVKYGLYKFDITAGETVYYNFIYKMGAERSYTSYRVGYSRYNDKPVYSLGLGLGLRFDEYKNNMLSIDFSCNQVIYNGNFAGGLNLLNVLNVSDEIFISRKASIIVGPSMNVYFTDEKVNGYFGTLPVPYTLYSFDGENTGVRIWLGFNLGFSFNI